MSNYLEEKVITSKSDRKHFYASNQSHHCWHKYNEYVLCVKKASGDEDACGNFRAQAISFCPEEWVTNWDEARKNGKFLGVQEHSNTSTKHHH